MYFRQALMECDDEWSTHKKLIKTREKGLRNSIPPNFPYFHAEWSSAGFVFLFLSPVQVCLY